MEGVRVFVGGIIPAQDIPELKKMGVAEVFLPGASTQDVIRLIEEPFPLARAGVSTPPALKPSSPTGRNVRSFVDIRATSGLS